MTRLRVIFKRSWRQIFMLPKAAKIFVDFLGNFDILHFQIKTDVATFWVTLESLGLFLFQHLVTLAATKT